MPNQTHKNPDTTDASLDDMQLHFRKLLAKQGLSFEHGAEIAVKVRPPVNAARQGNASEQKTSVEGEL
jgi:hypothetical protein